VTTTQEVNAILATIDDPEMPLSIVDLGIVGDVEVEDDVVRVAILPTFVGCPALDMIRREIEAKVGGLEGVGSVEVRFLYDPPWTTQRISPRGREALRRHGVVTPEARPAAGSDTVPLNISALPCPFCGSSATTVDSPFGPTRCRLILYCRACGNPFEGMKRLSER
jgi:ring-1,2-phenylacetyl-CoA epoxidase subunit PaaD